MIIYGTQEEIDSLECSLEEFLTHGACSNISCNLCIYPCDKHDFGEHIKIIVLNKEILDEMERNIATE